MATRPPCVGEVDVRLGRHHTPQLSTDVFSKLAKFDSGVVQVNFSTRFGIVSRYYQISDVLDREQQAITLFHTIPPILQTKKSGITRVLGRFTYLKDKIESRLLKIGYKDFSSQLRSSLREGIAELIQCCNQDNSVGLKKLIVKGINLNLTYPEVLSGWTALHHASSCGKAQCVEVLLQHGALTEIKAKKGHQTPLHLAAQSGHLSCVQLLVMHGANIEARTKISALTPMHMACFFGHVEVLNYLYSRCVNFSQSTTEGINALMLSASKGHQNCLAFLLSKKLCGDINAVDSRGYTALHFAVKGRHLACAEVLLEHQANAELLNTNGESAWYLAVKNDDVEMIKLLIRHADVPLCRGFDLKSPSYLAAFEGKTEIFELLTEDLKQDSKKWMTSLYMFLQGSKFSWQFGEGHLEIGRETFTVKDVSSILWKLDFVRSDL
ncbi:ankyrin repeat domain-containing protein [Parashewanella curva]|uniref:Ankyrin repeat domain-containing protein n=1 Tax=Parashewanella curva TaxID=2338552 RepID=A0A3L8PYL0_9GAMM|nr:ankyrin repeat domain-containing protein [Parashewanella curva]RLV60434.1 ankyrin repeat domain-containing protein [Parashewanella curva]